MGRWGRTADQKGYAVVPRSGKEERRSMRAFGILMFTTLLMLALRSSAEQPKLDPLAKPNMKLAPGYVLALNVSIHATDEEELCGEFPLDRDGNIHLTVGAEPLPPLALQGVTVTGAKARILAAI